MNTLENLARYESPHSGLAFRATTYAPGHDADLVIDCLALANAQVSGRRYLFFGIDVGDGDSRSVIGISRADFNLLKRRCEQLIADCIEPRLDVAFRATKVDGRLVAYMRLKNCSSVPYLTRQAIGDRLPAGVGFIRRGAHNYPLQRSDMEQMFARKQQPAAAPPAIRIGFPGTEPGDRLTLAALPLNKLPSELAEARLKSLIAAKQEARELFGRTETHFSRLMHARLYGMDVPFAKRSDDSLLALLETVDSDYSAADNHYIYEVRAHKLNLLVANDGEANLHNSVLRVSLPRMDDIGIADRVHAEALNELQPDGYPAISLGSRTISLAVELGTLYAGRSIRALREPLRFWARQQAAGKAVPVDYELSADELPQTVKGSLIIYIDRAALKSV